MSKDGLSVYKNESMSMLKEIKKDIEEIKAAQKRILEIAEDALCSTTSSDFERKQLIAQHGGDVLAAMKEHNRRQRGRDALHAQKQGKAKI